MKHRFFHLWIVLFMGVEILCPDPSIAGPFGPSNFEECRLKAAREAGSNYGLSILIKECRKTFKKELDKKKAKAKEDSHKECLAKKKRNKYMTKADCGYRGCLMSFDRKGSSEPVNICVPSNLCNLPQAASRWVNDYWRHKSCNDKYP
mgnify:CR=1 FL=1